MHGRPPVQMTITGQHGDQQAIAASPVQALMQPRTRCEPAARARIPVAPLAMPGCQHSVFLELQTDVAFAGRVVGHVHSLYKQTK